MYNEFPTYSVEWTTERGRAELIRELLGSFDPETHINHKSEEHQTHFLQNLSPLPVTFVWKDQSGKATMRVLEARDPLLPPQTDTLYGPAQELQFSLPGIPILYPYVISPSSAVKP